MEVMSRSTWNRSLQLKKRSHPTCSDREMIQKDFDQSRMKINFFFNISLIESSSYDREKYEYEIGFDLVPYP